MDSDFQQQKYQHHFQDLQRQFPHQKQQMNTLTRFRSAPSTYFASFLDAVDNTVSVTNCNDGGGSSGGGGGGGGERGDFSTARPLSPETENIFARFMSSMGDVDNNNNNSSSQNSMIQPPQQPPQFMVGVKQETETLPQQPPQQQVVYQSQSKPPLARQKSASMAMENPFTAVSGGCGGGGGSMGMDSMPPQMMKIGGGNNQNDNTSSGLTRHSSSPAGFFANILNIDDGGFGVMKGMGNYGGGNGQINFTSAPSTSGVMSQNSDVGTKRFSNSVNNNDGNYMTGSGYPMTSWDDSILSDNFSRLDDDRKTFSELNASENQIGEGRNRPPLSHQLSLPNTSAELSAMEKLLQFQDSVPCRIRAKRGCATHPRSIAERVRRTRISERMRKLQDLVPNMDKQTNTADMLDLAVEYIKDLQEQVKILADNRDKCTCS